MFKRCFRRAFTWGDLISAVLVGPGYILITRYLAPTEWIQIVRGIRVVCTQNATGSRFLEDVAEAIELIASTDVRRMKRLEENVKLVVQALGNGTRTSYLWPASCVIVQYREFSQSSSDSRRIGIASSMIHEATHGWLNKRNFPYLPRTRARIECVCVREEIRFLRKLVRSPEVEFYISELSSRIRDNARAWESVWSTQDRRRRFCTGCVLSGVLLVALVTVLLSFLR